MEIALVHMRQAGTGGTERYLNQIAAHLAERGHRPVIVCRSHEASPHPQVRFVRLHGPALGGAWRMWAFARAVERHVARGSYDLVFGLGKTWTHDVIRLGGGCHGTYLELAHDATRGPLGRALGSGACKHRLALAIERRALAPGAYRRVITNSHMVRRDVIRRHGVPAEAIDVIHNGVDLERFRPETRAGAGARLRAELGWGERERVFLFLGTGYGRKGLDRVLEAFPELLRERPESRLLVVGYDSARPDWESRARELGLGELVRFLGGRRDAEVCYAAADVYLLPTRYDPFANSTLEALASGLPVITSAENGGSELIEEGVQGSVLPPAGDGDALRALGEKLLFWSSAERIETARSRARARAAEKGVESMTATTAEVLERVAGSLRSEPATVGAFGRA